MARIWLVCFFFLLAPCAIPAEDEARTLFDAFLERNRCWLNPSINDLSYTLRLVQQEEDGEWETVHRVWIKEGKRARWEKVSGPKGKPAKDILSALVTPSEESYRIFGEKKDRFRRLPGGDVGFLLRGITFETGLVVAAQRVGDCTVRIRERKKTVDLETVILDVAMEGVFSNTPLGITSASFIAPYHPLIDRVRVGFRLPDFLPLFEEGFGGSWAAPAYRVEFGPEFLTFAEGSAPGRIRVFTQQADPSSEGRMDLEFQSLEGQWLFKEGVRRKNGEEEARARLADISFEPMEEGLFDEESIPPEDVPPPRRLAALKPGEEAHISHYTSECYSFTRIDFEIKGGTPVRVEVFQFDRGERKSCGVLELSPEQVADLDRELDLYRNPNPYDPLSGYIELAIEWPLEETRQEKEKIGGTVFMWGNRASPRTVLLDLYDQLTRVEVRGTHFLEGTVTNDMGEALPGLKVRISQRTAQGPLRSEAITDGLGRFRVDGLAGENAGVSLNDLDPRIGYQAWPESDHKITIDREDAVILVKRHAWIQGCVTDSTGKPIQDYHVLCHDLDHWQGIRYNAPLAKARMVFTEAFEVYAEPGAVIVEVRKDGYEPACSEVLHLSPGQRAEGLCLVLERSGSLSGAVRCMDPDTDLSKAMVYAMRGGASFPDPGDPHAPVGPDGGFTLFDIWPGEVKVMAFHPEQCPSTPKTVFLEEGRSQGKIELFLDQGAMLSGRVFVGGVPTAKAKIEARHLDTPESERSLFGLRPGKTLATYVDKKPVVLFKSVRNVESGSDGSYLFKNLLPGRYEIAAVLSDHTRMKKTLSLNRGERLACDLSFDGQGVIEGTVVVNGMAAKKGVFLHLSLLSVPNDDRRIPNCWTNPDEYGRYGFYHLLPGRYRVSATFSDKEGGKLAEEKDLAVGEGLKVLDFNLERPTAGTVKGRVLENGLPAEGAVVLLEKGDGFQQSVYADEEGRFLFDVPEGEYTLSAMHRFQSLYERVFATNTLGIPVTVKADEPVEAEIAYQTGKAALSGRVFRGPYPVDQGVVALYGFPENEGGGLVSKVEIKSGLFVFKNLPPGRYRVTLEKPWLEERTVEVTEGPIVSVDFRDTGE